MRLRWGVGLLFVGVLTVCTASAANLYEVHLVVPVPQNPKETQTVLREAFLSEVVLVSGQLKARNSNIILNQADKADAYIDRYNYTHTEKTSAQNPEKIPNTQINVTFAPRLIDKLLNEAKFSAWATDRPLLLVLAKEDDGGFASISMSKSVSKQLQQALAQRGVMYELPKMDADDLLVLGAMFATPSDDQWALIKERYHYQAVLIGELTQHDQDGVVTWSGQWQLMMNNRVTPIDEMASDSQTVIAQTVDQVANVFIAAAAQANKVRQFMVSVQGIHSDENYRTVRDYLEKLTSAEMVKFIKTQDDTVIYQVTSKPSLEKTIASDSVLLPDGQNHNTDTQLFYSFNDVPQSSDNEQTQQ